MMVIRDEQVGDYGAVYDVNVEAFGKTAEADLVDRLRAEARPLISLVAEAEQGEIVGHILFSPVLLSGADFRLMGLGPMGVKNVWQRQGVGEALIEAGLARCREMRVPAVVVLGHSAYYPRFGFVPSVRFGIRSEYDVPDEVFMVQELEAGFLTDKRGTIQYHGAFAGV